MTNSFFLFVQAAAPVLLLRRYCLGPSSSLSRASSSIFHSPLSSSLVILAGRTNHRVVSAASAFSSSTSFISRRFVVKQQQQQQQASRLFSTTVATDAAVPSKRNNNNNNNNIIMKNNKANKKALSSASLSTTTSSSSVVVVVDNSLKNNNNGNDNDNSLPRFANLPNLHPLSKKALAAMGLSRMTEVQAKTWEAAVEGRDVLARARTGTGKTIAFLLPALERLLMNNNNNNNSNKKSTNTGGGIDMLVLSPTRELAAQIADQAGLLLQSHHPANMLSVQVMFGGTNKNQDLVKMERKVPTILVATPGRLKDHLENDSKVKGHAFPTLFRHTQVLVLDETDRLLDMGFRKDVEQIISFLPPKQERQTLLFSATLPQEVKQVLHATMNANYVTVDCIHDNTNNNGGGDSSNAEHTNAQVLQSHVLLRSDTNLVTGTVDILLHLLQQNNNKEEDVKMVVFFSTAKMVAYFASLFNDELNIPVWEIHSRKTQSYRTNASNQFRQAKRGVLFTSDVSARGVDYPDVTHVVQLGMADSRESYIHRLGRTGRAGKQGEGLLVLADLEKGFLKQLADIDIPLNKDMQSLVDSPSSSSQNRLQSIFTSMKNGKNKELIGSAESAYRAMLGFYNGKLKRVSGDSSTATLVDFANGWALQSGLNDIPGIDMRTIRKMGLENAPGLKIDKNPTTTAKQQPTSTGKSAASNSSSGNGRSAQSSGSARNNGKDGGVGASVNGRQPQQQQQHPRNNGNKSPATGSSSRAAASVDGPRPLQSRATTYDSSRKRPSPDSGLEQRRNNKEDRQPQQQPSARRYGSSSGPKSRDSGNGQRWESSDSRRAN